MKAGGKNRRQEYIEKKQTELAQAKTEATTLVAEGSEKFKNENKAIAKPQKTTPNIDIKKYSHLSIIADSFLLEDIFCSLSNTLFLHTQVFQRIIPFIILQYFKM